MFEQDYLIRQIKEMIRALLKLLFNIDTDMSEETVLEESAKNELDRLLDMANSGMIHEAQTEVLHMNDLKISLLFYLYINEKDDSFLNANNYSRSQIEPNIKDLLSKYGLSCIGEMFLDDL